MKTKIFMGICSTGSRVDGQCYWQRRMEKKYGDRIEFVFPEIYIGRIFHDYARSAYVDMFMATDCDMLFFLDSDVVPPENLFDLVTEHGDKWELAAAPYPVWQTQTGYSGPQITYTVYEDRGEPGKMFPAPIPEKGLGWVAGAATGCLFIKRSVIQGLTKPYFEFKYNPETREMTEGEDLGFCVKVAALGKKFFIDYGMRCHHFKQVSLLDVQNFVEHQKDQVIDTCDKEIRKIVAKKQLEKMTPRPKIEIPKTHLILPK